MRLRPILGALAAAALSACAPATKVVTNRAADYTGRPARLYVVHKAGLGFGAPFAGAFRQKFADLAKPCGVETAFGEVTGMELDSGAVVKDMKAFHPDAILSIALDGGTVNQYGSVLVQKYDARLNDVKTKKIVWRGKLDFNRGATLIPLEERAMVLAADLTNALKQDTILQGCPVVVPGDAARAAPGAAPPPQGLSAGDAPK